MLVYAIIPARSGSKGVPNKNIRLLHGHPLLAWSIAAAKLCPSISRVVVSTDSEEYAAIAQKYDAKVPFLRPKEFAQDTSSDKDFLLHALNWFKINEQLQPSLIALLRPTTPFRDPCIIEDAITKLIEHEEYTSACSGFELPESPAKYFSLKEDGTFTGFLDEHYLDLRRQDCPKAYVWDGHVDILRTNTILSLKNIYGKKRFAIITQKNIEIDTEDEFTYAEYFAQTHKNQIYTYLENNYEKN